ncbi:(2,3-dihydroxybenzoyl)adenylate synthase [Glacieibacterium megasporae]|uniref:(2,3-dihydroxybenzoyl)adenylate synthase n=1 Tax=Glacieibacterium megasporae TaxID=2835787 RepID=UPI001C1E8C4C|nr:AMP-binding protein [Polymorphobacter megasporae]UAJ10510.1 AMP-binding protein [Polymorphobacter megasporae]
MDGVIPFPDEFAERYRAKGYWRDEPLRTVFRDSCGRFADRTALIDVDRTVTFRELDLRSTNLALNLLDLGIKPRDRLVVQMPNAIEFGYLHLALQKIGAIPVLALPPHRFREISFFVATSDAVATITPDAHREFSFTEMVKRIRHGAPSLKYGIVMGRAPEGFVSLADLIDRPAKRPETDLDRIVIDPVDPALFLLSGGTTGIPKLIPRTHNDYAYNSRMASSVCGIDQGSVLLDVLPIGHNLPLACPGLQGFLMAGAATVLHTAAGPEDVFPLIERHEVTHIHAVPALLIRWTESKLAEQHDLTSVRVIQSGGQRLQPEVRRRTASVFRNVIVQENFGMAEGLLMFVRLDDPPDVRMETVGRKICTDDEILLLDEDDQPVPFGEVGELCCRGPYTLRGYYKAPEHNARAFTTDGFYRSGDLLRQHPSGNYMVEGRKKDLINRGAEKISAEEIEELILRHPAVENVACVPMPDPVLGEKNCACVVLRQGQTLDLSHLVAFLDPFELAKYKYPERIERFESLPLSNFGKVSKKDLVAIVIERMGQPV